MTDTRAAAELQRQVDAVPYWHHTIDLGHGVVTPGGGGDTSYGLARVALPKDLTGKTVLDIGAWDGAYSFECERRGAARVLASDRYIWRQESAGKGGFELARRALGSNVEDLEIDVFDISPETVGMFDVVLFLGVLYHLRDPFGGLARAASVARELLIVETHIDLLDCERPALAFYPGAELCGDATNWFGPNVPALVGMLEDVDFSDIEIVGVEPQVGDREWLETTGDGRRTQGTRRAVVHARRSRPPADAPAPEDANESTAPVAGGPTSAPAADPPRVSPREDDRALARENRDLCARRDALAAEVIALRHRAQTLERELARMRELVAALRGMRVVRWTARARRIVHRLRRRVSRRSRVGVGARCPDLPAARGARRT